MVKQLEAFISALIRHPAAVEEKADGKGLYQAVGGRPVARRGVAENKGLFASFMPPVQFGFPPRQRQLPVVAVTFTRAAAYRRRTQHLETLDALNDNKYSCFSVRYDLKLIRHFCLHRTGEPRAS